MASQDQPDTSVGAMASQDQPDTSVGVLGWLGFIILNVAAWGIIAVSSQLQVWLGFAVCLVYTVLLSIMALLIVRWGDRFRSFENLLWVLSAIFICVLGVYLSINVVCMSVGECGSGPMPQPPVPAAYEDLRKLLPNTSSIDLQEWAADPDFYKQVAANFFALQGRAFFTGRGGSILSDILHQSDGNLTEPVMTSGPSGEYLTGAQNFASLDGDVFFTAQPQSFNGPSGIGIYKAALGARALLVKAIESSPSSGYASVVVNTAFVEDGLMYLKVQESCSQCNYCAVRSIIVSDGTTEGTVDLRGNDRCNLPFVTPTQAPPLLRKPTKTLWSILFLAIVPMIVVAASVMWWKKLPGLVLHLYYGVAAATVVVYLIAASDHGIFEPFFEFLKGFITVYTGMALLVITLQSVLVAKLPVGLESMVDWIVILAGLPFVVIIHVDLEIPMAQEAWKWIIYVFTMFFQMFVSIAIGRTPPMVFGAVQAFVTAWKISREIVRAATGNDSMDQVQLLITLGLMAFQGVGIIVIAILYASRRQQIEEFVRGGLRRCFRRRSEVLPE